MSDDTNNVIQRNKMTKRRITPAVIIVFIFAFLVGPVILHAEVKANLTELINDQNKKLFMTWGYEGGDMPTAEMYFWSNGLLILDSKLFSKSKSKVYFTWKMSEDGNRLELSFIDPNIPFEKFLAVEKSHTKHIISFDESAKSILYRVIDHQSFYFGNWLFEKK